MKLAWEKCSKEATGEPSHVGHKHQACGKRKKGDGSPRKDCGNWRAA